MRIKGAPLVDVLRQAQLVDTDAELDPEEALSEEEESHPLGSRVPLVGEEFEAFESSSTRTDSSHLPASSYSATPLSPDHPLTHVSPTPTPTRASFHRRTAHMTMRAQPAMSPSLLASMTEAMALSDSAFRNSEGDELGDEDADEDREDESLDTDDERKEEEEVLPEGQQLATLAADTAIGEPLGLGYWALRHRKLAVKEDRVPNTFEVDSKDGRVYTNIPAYVPSVAHVQTPPSPEWSSGSLPISPSSPVGAQLELHRSILHDHTHRLDVLPPTLFTDIDRSLEREQERTAVTFGALWRPVLASKAWAGQTDAQRAALWHAIYDT
ncbi:hypothetical protein Tco_1318890 [Tanacetum coccineum]